jgi:outer membrane protein, adhesin transport system
MEASLKACGACGWRVCLALWGCRVSVRVWVGLGVWALALCVWADEMPQKIWSFDALLHETGRTYPAIVAKQRAEAAARADMTTAEWQRYPTPGVEASVGAEGRREMALFLQQPLWTGGRITAGIDAAGSRHSAAREDVAVTRREVLTRLVDAYAEVRRRQAQQRIHRDNVRQHERLMAMIERRVKSEISPEVDKDLARSRVYQAANELSVVTQALANGLVRLSELAGAPVLGVSMTDKPVGVDVPDNRVEGAMRALAAAPVMARLQYQREAAEADIRSEQASLWPKASLRVEQREGAASDQRALFLLESQFGAGFSAGTKVDAALARRDALIEERRAALRAVESEVSEAFNQRAAATVRLENSRMNKTSAVTVFESYTRQYVVGQKSWIDVLNAVREANVAMLSLEDSEVDVVRAGLRLRLLMGEL